MSSFTQGLKDKIAALDDEKTELEDALLRVSSRLEMLEELLAEEQELSEQPLVEKKKRGRPRGSKKKIIKTPTENEKLYAEAVATLPEEGTTPEMQERLVNRYSPTPRPVEGRGPGIKAGTKEDTAAKTTKSDKTISIEDD